VTDPVTELLVFEVGDRVFAAEVSDAIRIGAVRDVALGALVVATCLGTPLARQRGIVVVDEAGLERTLVVDRVLGVRRVPEDDVRPLPAFAAACITSGALAGLVLLDESPTPLVDLATLVRERAPDAAVREPS
jgi:chemotaxis signal transduction protein